MFYFSHTHAACLVFYVIEGKTVKEKWQGKHGFIDNWYDISFQITVKYRIIIAPRRPCGLSPFPLVYSPGEGCGELTEAKHRLWEVNFNPLIVFLRIITFLLLRFSTEHKVVVGRFLHPCLSTLQVLLTTFSHWSTSDPDKVGSWPQSIFTIPII